MCVCLSRFHQSHTAHRHKTLSGPADKWIPAVAAVLRSAYFIIFMGTAIARTATEQTYTVFFFSFPFVFLPILFVNIFLYRLVLFVRPGTHSDTNRF